jgi:D-alanyl-D-alanine dipeptidase
MGYSLMIWDAFRPVEAQFRLWAVCPDPNFVANPNTGYSSHSKGSAVDVTLITSDGKEVPMPTAFDAFSSLADRDYTDIGETIANNALLLEQTMIKYGFDAYFSELGIIRTRTIIRLTRIFPRSSHKIA